MKCEITIVASIAKAVSINKNGDDVAGFVSEVVFLEFLTVDEICDTHVLCIDSIEQLLFGSKIEKPLGVIQHDDGDDHVALIRTGVDEFC